MEVITGEIDSRVALCDGLSPDKIFERRWAITVLDCALAALQHMKHFEQFKPFITAGESGVSYSRLAAKLAMSEGAVKVAVHRLRRRFAQSLRGEIARTVVKQKEVEQEIRYLLAVIRG